jgi:citrate lyase subunit beta/citryl-CoA lyase
MRAHERIGAARTLLFVPGARPDRFNRALATAADLVVVDLEASVRPVDKAAARAAFSVWLATCAEPSRVLVRVNPATSEAFAADAAVVRERTVGGIVLAMTESGDEIRRAVSETRGCPIVALVETARGLLEAQRLAREAGVARLAFGNMDYATDTGTRGRESMIFPAAQLVLASRAARLPPPIAGVTAAFRDDTALAQEAAWERDQGFGAKFCIHPAQVPIVDGIFRPTADEVAWARRVLAAAGDSFACEVDGELVDRPVVERARRIIDANASA